jgi:dTDP-4-dehydrorhamnose 3,5-epimerase
MSHFHVEETSLQGLKVIQRRPRKDSRGQFTRAFCSEELSAAGWTTPVMQINHSITHAVGSIRGLHYQKPPKAEKKMVLCLRGRVWDVAVDLRSSSAKFLSWHAEELSAENNKALLIPEGFAHGFQVLEKESELLYLHSEKYAPQIEDGLSPVDPRLSIPWPLAIGEMSERDRGFPFLSDKYKGVTL